MAWPSPAPMTAVAGQLMTAASWNTQVRDALLILKTSLDDSGNFAPPVSTLTLVTDSVTPTGNKHKLETEGAAATDTLTTITVAGNIRDGHVLLLCAFNAAHVVTVKNGGNIVLDSGEFALNAAARTLTLQLHGTTWYEIARSSPRGEVTVQAKTATYTMVEGDDIVLASGTFAVTLPSVALTPRRARTVKNTGTGTITLTPASGTIDAAATQAILAGDSLTVVPDGTNWSIV